MKINQQKKSLDEPIRRIRKRENIVSFLETIRLIRQHFQIVMTEEFLIHVQ